MNIELKITPLEHVRKCKQQYLSLKKDIAEELAENLVDDAKTLGVEEVFITKVQDWWVISSNKDWLKIENEDNTEVDLFNKLVALADGGVNAFRREILVNAFAKSVFTLGSGNLSVISGNCSEQDINNLVSSVKFKERIVAFKMEPNEKA